MDDKECRPKGHGTPLLTPAVAANDWYDKSLLDVPSKAHASQRTRPRSCVLVGRDTFQSRTHTPFDRRFVVLIVGLIHHDGLQVDFLRRRLLAQIADGDVGAETALNESIVVAATEDITGLDEVDYLFAGIDADDRRLAVGRFKRLDGADRHRIVGGEHTIDLRIEPQKALHHFDRWRTGIVRRLRGEELDVGKLLERVLVRLHADDAGGQIVGTFEDHDASLLADRVDEIARSREREL